MEARFFVDAIRRFESLGGAGLNLISAAFLFYHSVNYYYNTLKSFNYADALRVVCRDICAKTPIFQRYNLDYVDFVCGKSNNNRYGGLASLTSLRFEGGALATFRRGAFWKTPELVDANGRTLLYILTVYVPRFWNLSLSEKIQTLTHELYHIAPDFNGDVRRFPGKNYAHGSSKKKYDAVVAKYAGDWLAHDPDPRIWGFLQNNEAELTRRFEKIMYPPAKKVKLIKIDREEAIRLNPSLAEVKK